MLKFCFGASGAGKSTRIYEEIIKRSFDEPDTDFIIIVPDQFTMQTQKDVVRMHPSHAIMNIDVLSFGRLSHRIFEEVGLGSFSVLDDVGKSLILRRVADMLGDRLPVIGSNMHKTGYIDEVKSTISEFMMYGIGDKELAVLEEKSAGKGVLNSKIKDLRLIYSEFHKYISGKYITTEETLDILCSAIPRSSLIRNAVIVFDGFTGFTPIQYRVIEKLLSASKEVLISVTIDPKQNPYDTGFEEQELFALSKKTVRDLERIEMQLFSGKGQKARDRSTDIFLKTDVVKRLEKNPSLSFIEQNLFRYNSNTYPDKPGEIEVFEASSPANEVRQVMIKITDAIRNKRYAYRDIAIVCGSLEQYADLINISASKFDIPVYIDQNISLMLNPFIEYITSAINIVIGNFKYEDVFHYMRSGMTDFSKEDTDVLENYVRALGIKGQKQWNDRFSRHMPKKFRKGKSEAAGERELALMDKLDGMRQAISDQLSPLFDAKNKTAREITLSLFEVIEKNESHKKLDAYKEMFREQGNLKKAKEYDQIYEKIMSLLRQIMDLIGDDELTMSEYKDILSAGFGEIEVGTIPQDVDRIIVGDIERTRLKEIKLLFFVGVSDGSIPAGTGSGGILSDIDREFLSGLDTDISLAPTPRQQMYIQRLYLYMNLTKPTDKLYLSYPQMDNAGKSLKCAYLVPKLLQMFPLLEVARPEDGDFESQNVSKKDSYENAADMIRRFAGGHLSETEEKEFLTLYNVLSRQEDADTNLGHLVEAAFSHYESRPLATALARTLYGATLEMSVSRLELFAACSYAHFLKYGLGISERDEYDFDVSDLGNVFHDVLEKYTSEILSRKIDWRDLSKEKSDEILNKALIECTDGYGETILHSSARNQAMIDRIHRILSRTVDTLKYQIEKGKFNPAFLEMDFREAGSLKEMNFALEDEEKQRILGEIKLRGKIDRVDLYEEDGKVYVKVIDFKSGKKQFSVASLYYGLQLQLVMYMDVALAAQKKLNGDKEAVPAAILYYHIDDPMAQGTADTKADDINQAIREQLKMTGLVSENMDIVQMLDNTIISKSDIIPVGIKKDGSFTAASSVVTPEDYSALRLYANDKIREFGRKILEGDIAVDPYEKGQTSSCKWCAYKSICGFDKKIPGYDMRMLDLTDDAAKELIVNMYKADQ
jgi:ATP-dependent helicase/nuclease subunit B